METVTLGNVCEKKASPIDLSLLQVEESQSSVVDGTKIEQQLQKRPAQVNSLSPKINLHRTLQLLPPRRSRSNCQGKLFETRSPTERKACITDAFVPVVHRGSSVQLEDVALEQRNPSQPVVGYRCDCRQTGCLIFAAQVSVVKTFVLGSASALNVG
ncbi:hypothetical protein DAPPUDRAFT_113120 [Daphnia pulex]|uniref:Uncharacterized protein n=1 Tax=Daphnia pulex TaxID=6669 RepID=E9HE48_DAPPU|nr:hypothetical protein DAPPUDRAFT_113120 [Daphnia pulex]|eukprot:EFX69992.1 hypothetical protein DAPPUDRAFT_113120 [Daphnia pulex]